jgi:hypothetical protein
MDFSRESNRLCRCVQEIFFFFHWSLLGRLTVLVRPRPMSQLVIVFLPGGPVWIGEDIHKRSQPFTLQIPLSHTAGDLAHSIQQHVGVPRDHIQLLAAGQYLSHALTLDSQGVTHGAIVFARKLHNPIIERVKVEISDSKVESSVKVRVGVNLGLDKHVELKVDSSWPRRAFAWGRGTHGALGIGQVKDCFVPQKLDKFETMMEVVVSQILNKSSTCLQVLQMD